MIRTRTFDESFYVFLYIAVIMKTNQTLQYIINSEKFIVTK